jgi:hypothetical protein
MSDQSPQFKAYLEGRDSATKEIVGLHDKIQSLEAEIARLRYELNTSVELLNGASKREDELVGKLEIAIDALSFYANELNWPHPLRKGISNIAKDRPDEYTVSGWLARKTLVTIEGKDEN